MAKRKRHEAPSPGSQPFPGDRPSQASRVLDEPASAQSAPASLPPEPGGRRGEARGDRA